MSQSSSASKGIPRDVIDKSRRDRAKNREKQKSDANQKAKKALEAAEKERLKYEGLRDKQKELYKNYDDGKHPEFKEEYENATKDFQDSRSKLADLQIVIKQAQADRISHYRFEHCTHGYLSYAGILRNRRILVQPSNEVVFAVRKCLSSMALESSTRNN